jgi:hypothetical protein
MTAFFIPASGPGITSPFQRTHPHKRAGLDHKIGYTGRTYMLLDFGIAIAQRSLERIKQGLPSCALSP